VGIYPTTDIKDRQKHPDGTETWTEIYNDFSGRIRTRTVKAEAYVDRWDNCYCCSCPEHTNDPYCRNHGYAGTRACDQHGQPGSEFEVGDDLDTPDPTRPLASVQAARLGISVGIGCACGRTDEHGPHES
jgi:hypothetical protein